MIVVSDTSCVSNLIVLSKIDLLHQLFGKVILPQSVFEEIVTKGVGKAGWDELINHDWIEIQTCSDDNLLKRFTAQLDEGEAEAIALALQIHADLILIDEAKGRRIAISEGLNIVGTVGVLLRSKQLGLIESVMPLIDDLCRVARFRISDDLYQEIKNKSGE